MRCDAKEAVHEAGWLEVSIPAGFSDALRLQDRLVHTAQIIVSIPAGFSDALRRYRLPRKGSSMKEFQSLLGFLMRCDDLYPIG